MTVIAVICLCAFWGCTRLPPEETKPGPELTFLPVLPLTNEEFQVVDMAAAHGALTIELEVAADADVDAIARRVVGPVQSRYAEILVYFYDRAQQSALPLQRVQWTPRDGYEMLSYQTP